MNEFSTFIFKENEVKTNNKRVSKERAYLIGVLLSLISIVLYLLNINYAMVGLATGVVIVSIGRIILSGKNPSIGHRPLKLQLKENSVVIGNEEIEPKNKADVLVKIVAYKGQLVNQKIAFYKTYSGNDNSLKFWHNDKEVEFNFVLESKHHKDKLIAFCEQNGFTFQRKTH